MQMVEGIGDDMDLASLAGSVPELEDLLEQEDDAPIIRLINAILTEAVKNQCLGRSCRNPESGWWFASGWMDCCAEVEPKRGVALLLVSRI